MDYSALIAAVMQFWKDNQELLSKGMSAVVSGGAGVALWKFVAAYRKQRRQKQIPSGTFPFLVIPPHSKDVLQQLLSDRAAQDSSLKDDQLASFNIPYQVRREDQNMRQEIENRLNEKRWLLIVGRTGLGKTREAAEVAKLWNHEGWTVLKLLDQGWLDESLEYPKEIGTKRKLLFFVDDLHQLIYLSREVKYAPGAEDPNKPLRVPLPDRLLRTLERYEKECGVDQIRVIATARNERNAEHPNTLSEWEKLALDDYPKLKAKFELYELPDPEERALVALLEDWTKVAGISAKAEDFPAISRRNDGTFSNIVENLSKVRNPERKLVLSLETFTDTLKGTWQERYDRAVRNYQGARYIYDAVELLQQLGIELLPDIVTPTARLIAGGRGLRQWLYWWQIRQTLPHLIQSERILEPRDGQIEAKQSPVEVVRFIPAVRSILLQLFKRDPNRFGNSLYGYAVAIERYEYYEDALIILVEVVRHFPHAAFVWFEKGYVEAQLERYEEAIGSYEQAIALQPGDALTYFNYGFSLRRLERYEEAVESYEQAIALQPEDAEDLAVARMYVLRGMSLGELERYEEAVESYDQAIALQLEDAVVSRMRGASLHQLERYEEAIISYEQAIALEPEDAIAHFNRGASLHQLERYEEAIRSYEQAIALQPELQPEDSEDLAVASVYVLRGVALGELERYEEAVESYDQAIALQPEDAKAHFNRGVTLARLERYEEAIGSYEQVIALQPEDAKAHFNRGASLHQLERYEEAVESYEQAIALEPEDAKAHFNRGVALGELERYEKAVESYDQAIALQPEDAKAHFNRGVALGELERYEEEIGSYEQVIALQPEDAKAHFNRGLALDRLGRYEEAIISYEQAIALEPEDAIAHFNRGASLHQLKRYEEAVESYEQVIALQPEDAVVARMYVLRGMALGELERYEEAVESYDQAIALQPEDTIPYHFSRGVALDRLERYEEAVESYDQAIALQPEDAIAYHFRGSALHRLERYEEAVESYEQAIALQPEDAKAHFNRGVALDRLERYEEAVISYEQAIALQPEDAIAYHFRGSALHRLGRYEDAIANYDEAIKLQPEDVKAYYNNRGLALSRLERYEDAIASYDRALEIQSESDYDDLTLYNKACSYALRGKINESMQYLYQAISLNPELRESAKNDPDFDGIREDKQFQQLCGL